VSSDPASAAWESLGLRHAQITVKIEDPIKLGVPTAAYLRGALGRAAVEGGHTAVEALVVPAAGPPGIWFEGWPAMEASSGTSLALRLHLVGSAGPAWPGILSLLEGLRVGRGRIRVAGVSWLTEDGAVESGSLGPEVAAALPVPGTASAVHVVAEAPLQLTRHDVRVAGIPAWDLLVRSAGERLRQVTEAWGVLPPGLPTQIGQAVQAARAARTVGGTFELQEATRVTGRSRGVQWIWGVTGRWSYEGVEASGLPLLLAATELGLGKGVAFGCGRIHLELASLRT
jgi:hypothetical protein